MSQRLPPSNIQAEQALLGAMLANNKAYQRVASFLTHEHFVDPIHARIFQEITADIKAGRLADAVTLKAKFEHSGILEEVGGTPYLAQLLGAMVGIINAGEYGRAIYNTWVQRRLIELGRDAINLGFGADIDMPPIDTAREIAQQAFALAADPANQTGPVTLAQAAHTHIDAAEARHRGGAVPGLTCRFKPVDNALGRLSPKRFLILAGRPGMGKTALATQIALGVGEELADEAERGALFSGAGGYVLIWSLEMDADEIGGRVVSGSSGVDADLLERGDLNDDLCARLARAQVALERLPILIMDRTNLTAADVIAETKAMMQQYRIRFVVIDHLGKLRADRRDQRAGQQYAVAQQTSDLKNAARDLSIPILALAHLGRDVDRRPDPRPVLADLMYAGEGDADVVAFLWRPEKYLSKAAPEHNGKESEEALQKRREAWRKQVDAAQGKAELIVAKRRGGRESLTVLEFDGETTSFRAPGIKADDYPELWTQQPPDWSDIPPITGHAL